MDILPEGETAIAYAEWVSPPMLPGVEYRTSEMYNGKPVYAKLMPFGNLPNNTTAAATHNITNIDICTEFTIDQTGVGTAGPINGDIGVTAYWANATSMNITTNKDYSSTSVNVLLRYTKSTD